MSGLLTEMAQSSLARLEQARARESEQMLWTRVCAAPKAPRLKLSPEGFDIIAECKLASPSAGDLSAHTTDIDRRVQAYAQGGACAVSVLTEPTRFGGSLAHLEQTAQTLGALGVPVMRKDFLVDPYQVAEARLAGAGGILVIVRMLMRAELDALIEAAARLQLFVLIEAFDEADIRVAAGLVTTHAGKGVRLLVGVNSRDLVTLKVVPGRLEELTGLLPAGVPLVAESGVADATDAARLARAGYSLALIGSALMTAGDPAALLADMIKSGRAAR
jgi:indole-3-glycerol phosphate synthase